VSGLILASSPLVSDNLTPAAPPVPSEQPDRPTQPDNPAPTLPQVPGTGVLRQGDSGHGVYELQVRLLQVPNTYDGGAIDGRYGKEVRAAVARFQQWYGVRGDEAGVYGNNTRHALMLRTR
jgi:peptidoglycan hydrolase-like protein with peptidoglycan-binding domain